MVQRGTSWYKIYKRIYVMEFKIFFATLKNRISNGYDVPEFFREIFAMITEVPEEEWGTTKDPITKKVKDDTLRSYAKRTITKKFAQTIVYRLSRDNFIDSINSHSVDTRELIANDFISYDSTLTAENVAEKTADWFIEIIQSAAGLAPKTELEQQKQQQLSADLKMKYGQYLLNEVGRHCPFPGCDRSLTKSANGKTIDSYDICLIDKRKAPEISNLLALCQRCYATYFLDDSIAALKSVKAVKKLLEAHNKNVSLLEDLSLEKNIIGVINNIKNLKAKDLVDVSLEPKEIKQKLNESEDIILYNQVDSQLNLPIILNPPE